jgi:2-polyprenyl-3-methyl-5-hydroxy-6-metoxy-1,4-benzoquinol methylase
LLDVSLDAHGGLDVGNLPMVGSRAPHDILGYWAKRRNSRIYLMSLLFAHYFCRDKDTVADVGCHSAPLVLMLPGFKRRYAIDPSPHAANCWRDVDGATFVNVPLEDVDVKALTGRRKFDLIMCTQVIEHVDTPASFAHMLLARARRVIVSTTFETPAGHIESHVHDPIDLEKFEAWFPRKPLGTFIARGPVGGKILAAF